MGRNKRCEHRVIWYYCKICHGPGICVHSQRRSRCKLCKGHDICDHLKLRRTCRLCKGTAFCEHDRVRRNCKLCKGSAICVHQKLNFQCKECWPMHKLVESKKFCVCCANRLCDKRRRGKILLCSSCDQSVPPRSETVFRNLLLPLVHHPPSSLDDLTIGGVKCDAQLRRADIAWYGKDRAIFVEVDEDGGHPKRDALCELGKLWDQTVAAKALLGERTTVFMIRVNPDGYDGARVTLKQRAEVVAAKLNDLIVRPLGEYDPKIPHLCYYFYHSKAQFHIDAARSHPESVQIMD